MAPKGSARQCCNVLFYRAKSKAVMFLECLLLSGAEVTRHSCPECKLACNVRRKQPLRGIKYEAKADGRKSLPNRRRRSRKRTPSSSVDIKAKVERRRDGKRPPRRCAEEKTDSFAVHAVIDRRTFEARPFSLSLSLSLDLFHPLSFSPGLCPITLSRYSQEPFGVHRGLCGRERGRGSRVFPAPSSSISSYLPSAVAFAKILL